MMMVIYQFQFCALLKLFKRDCTKHLTSSKPVVFSILKPLYFPLYKYSDVNVKTETKTDLKDYCEDLKTNFSG